MKTSLQLINHASILIKHGEISLLSDPWYQGDAFHKGWDLLHKTSDTEADRILDQITHIWISHEHPDHFSVKDLKYIYNLNKNIKILFQETLDKRVISFCKNLGFNVIEVKNFQKYFFDKNSYIKIIYHKI